MKENKDFVLDDDRLGSEITPKIMTDLKVTASWLCYLGTMGFSLCSLGIIGVGYSLFTMLSIGSIGAGNWYPSGYYIVLFISIVAMFLAIYLSVLMFQYGKGIKTFMDTGKTYALEEAFEKQKIYWTVSGILMTIFVGFYFIVFFIGLFGDK